MTGSPGSLTEYLLRSKLLGIEAKVRTFLLRHQDTVTYSDQVSEAAWTTQNAFLTTLKGLKLRSLVSPLLPFDRKEGCGASLSACPSVGFSGLVNPASEPALRSTSNEDHWCPSTLSSFVMSISQCSNLKRPLRARKGCCNMCIACTLCSSMSHLLKLSNLLELSYHTATNNVLLREGCNAPRCLGIVRGPETDVL